MCKSYVNVLLYCSILSNKYAFPKIEKKSFRNSFITISTQTPKMTPIPWMTEENKKCSLPKLILVQPLNTTQDEVSDNLQNTDTFGDIEVIDKQPVDYIHRTWNSR